MKRILSLVLSFFVIVFVTGCGSKVNLDLDYIESNPTKIDSVFTEFKAVAIEDIEGRYGIDTSLFTEILFLMDESLETSRMVAIFKPSTGGKKEIDKFVEKYNQNWSMGYFPEEEQLVKNASKATYGDYVIYIVADDTTKVLKNIKKYVVKGE